MSQGWPDEIDNYNVDSDIDTEDDIKIHNERCRTDPEYKKLFVEPVVKRPRGRPPKPKEPKPPKEPKVLKTANRQEYNKEYNKKYYKEKRNDIHQCEVCGGKYEHYNKKQHELTDKHIWMIEYTKKYKINLNII